MHEDKELNFERTLSKLDIGFVKVFIYVTLLDATEDDWELDSDYNVTCDHGKKFLGYIQEECYYMVINKGYHQ